MGGNSKWRRDRSAGRTLCAAVAAACCKASAAAAAEPPPVTREDDDVLFTLSNGIVRAQVAKASRDLVSLR